jgi:hypothetical protein
MRQKFALVLAILFFSMKSHAQTKTYDWHLYKTVYNVSFYTRWENTDDGTSWFYVKAVNNNESSGKQAGLAYVQFYDTNGYLTEKWKGNTEYVKANEQVVLLKIHLDKSNSVRYDFQEIFVSSY